MGKRLHTEGPWVKGKHDTDIIGADGFPVANVNATAVSESWEELGIDHWADSPGVAFIVRPEGEILANTDLILAAPDLLAACERASEGYQIVIGILDRTMPGWRRSYNFHHGKVQIDNAIAKAKGEPA